MSLIEKIDKELIAAMKQKDATKVMTLRLVKAGLTNYQIEKKKEKLDDNDCVEVLQRQVKQRRDSIDSYRRANRPDLADKEATELGILEAYLPRQLSSDEIRELTRQAIAESQASSAADIGAVMKVLMPKVKGRADGRAVQTAVRELLS